MAATPGHTKVAQEVALDRHVKLLDCPGIVFASEGPGGGGAEGERKRAEGMLRNVVKVELVEDPVAPGECHRVADSALFRADAVYSIRSRGDHGKV